MNWVHIVIELIIAVNLIAAVITVFREKRDIAATWAWLLVLFFLPVVGFIFYSFVGRKLPKNKMFQLKKETKLELELILERQSKELNDDHTEADKVVEDASGMATMFMNADSAFLSHRNRVKLITDGKELFHDMFEDIEKAKKHVHVEFYTFYDDQIGRDVLHLLEKKAKEGVEVRVLWDSWGSMGTKSKFFKHLRELGGYAAPFLGTHSAVTDFRLNFRDHRKIVVIDGQVAYTGGFNIGDQYLGRSKKFGYWRDTHMRIVGSAAYSLQARFVRDWNATDHENPINTVFDPGSEYFPVAKVNGNTSLQIVSSGPDSETENIKLGYLKLINSAHRSIWIQSPYLIPDDSVMDALHMAALSGVDVRIMIPHMPDHVFVYRATQYYARQCAKWGIQVYNYDAGFLHAKTMVVDGKLGSVGSANMDFRSFSLNFEVNAFIYDKKIAHELEEIFKDDIQKSTLQTTEMYDNQSWWLKFKQDFSRLLSPIL
ncbi:cardiolipin synthase [Pediococcus damnosus LMG 28219]|uniref:cardiolipin synthase n=1 Tax=Pediococcus damnosus TaxID=51663 RepID=UPI00061E1AC6|nr:cardiolipin synthase [Pediococcus damnosus]AMV60534.1 Cardiolipin synthetase [Pediococcus damnosus]AMV64849.1 Cardiolipin synthetase [Pediococcus damnosus]KJU74783.1 cardiolipin synthase [Pediococcus damnosus LMG 28219]PIO85398.1 cardiolipin synthase [Pediococcus damnosus]GEA92868.1 cardiolipin synthase [Pediococcus damnosus]